MGDFTLWTTPISLSSLLIVVHDNYKTKQTEYFTKTRQFSYAITKTEIFVTKPKRFMHVLSTKTIAKIKMFSGFFTITIIKTIDFQCHRIFFLNLFNGIFYQLTD